MRQDKIINKLKNLKYRPSKISIIISIFFILQLILVFWGGFFNQYVCVSDEKIYKSLALNVFNIQPAFIFHYPILYPTVLASSFLLGQNFLTGMYLINIIIKTISLIIIYRLLKVHMNTNIALLCVFVIAFSPIYFIYSRLVLAENLFCPLLIIAFLYHINYRGEKEIRYTILAASLTTSLFMTKYLALVLIPVFALEWILDDFHIKQLKNDWTKRLVSGAIYSIVVLSILVIYSLIYCFLSKTMLTFTLFKEIMGFSIGSAPDSVGYVFLPQFKWIVCYGAFALLGSLPIIFGIAVLFPRIVKSKNVMHMLIFATAIGSMLIYVAARHSSFIPYNSGGAMLKLLGRYVAYATPIYAIVFYKIVHEEIFSNCNEINQKLPKLCIKAIIHLIIIGITGYVTYAILYQKLIWKTPDDWLSGLRGLELYGYFQWGIIFLIGTVIIIMIIYFLLMCKKSYMKFYAISILLVMFFLANNISAIRSIPKNSMNDYAKVMKAFFVENVDKEMTIYCFEDLDYIEFIQMETFYMLKDELSSIWGIPVSLKDYGGQPFEINLNRDSYIMWNIENLSEAALDKLQGDYIRPVEDSDHIFINFNRLQIGDTNIENIKIKKESTEEGCVYSLSADNISQFCYATGDNIVFISEWNEEEQILKISIPAEYEKYASSIQIFDIENLTKSQELDLNVE